MTVFQDVTQASRIELDSLPSTSPNGKTYSVLISQKLIDTKQSALTFTIYITKYLERMMYGTFFQKSKKEK